MSSDYPFPIPEAMKSEILKRIAQANPPWGVLEDWSGLDSDPALFGYFNCWRGHTEMLLCGLKYLIEQVEPSTPPEDYNKRSQWEAVTGIVLALQHRLGQFEGLLEWARLTWPHDPELQARMKEEGWSQDTPDPKPDAGDTTEPPNNVLALNPVR